ncbi:response regulator [Chrysiogenes arsenatis]|uniref:response regulator n=1 Tax=Chrysiogenes arsenatis TaxID=309797 RepID=UPI000401FC50|nr:response regulator [Chrysiogenes arsenatis]
MYKGAILCVDDERIILESLKNQLGQEFGKEYIIELALSADEALEIIDDLQSESVSMLVVISDWLMPGMKGDELLLEIHQRMPQVAKIILSGQADESSIKMLHEKVQLQKFIAKPWKAEELITIIREGIRHG